MCEECSGTPTCLFYIRTMHTRTYKTTEGYLLYKYIAFTELVISYDNYKI